MNATQRQDMETSKRLSLAFWVMLATVPVVGFLLMLYAVDITVLAMSNPNLTVAYAIHLAGLYVAVAWVPLHILSNSSFRLFEKLALMLLLLMVIGVGLQYALSDTHTDFIKERYYKLSVEVIS